MDYSFHDSSCLPGQRDLIDLLPETNVDAWDENVEHSREPPVMKSKDKGRVNSDVVAIKSNSGDIGFVAVGRPNSDQRPPSTPSQHPGGSGKRPSKVKQHQKSSSNDEKYQSGSFPRMMANPAEAGIDNLGYQTISRSESYTYDDTGFNYYSHLDRNDAPQFVNSVRQPQYVRINTSQGTTQHSLLGARSGSYGDIPSTSQQIMPPKDTSAGHRSHRGVSESSARNQSTSQRQSSSTRPASETSVPTNENSRQSRPTSGRSSRRQSRDLDTIPVTPPPQPSPVPKLPPLCKVCGQNHGVTENHEYNYVDEVDEDLMCDICLQPLVDPYDTVCGHTFCNICLKNYLRVKNICPVDRVEIKDANSDCWQSSLILRKLVNKLQVTCPHEEFCKKTLQRCDLKDHLQDVCAGAIIRCPKSMYGCSYRGPRSKIAEHLKECLYKEFNDKLSDLHPFSEDVTIELFRPEGTAELGIMVVGGSDTPLHYVVIQDILKESLAAQDGRLQVGDIFVEINGEPMFSVTHAEARAALTKPSTLMRFTLLRDIPKEEGGNKENNSTGRSESPASYKEETVCLVKPPLEQLGIRISSSDAQDKGVYIIELIPDQVAETDGRLLVGDRIMKIGETDLTESTPEHAARIISSCDREVKILVRHPHLKSTVLCNEWTDDAGSKPRSSLKRSETFLTGPKMVKSKRTKKVISVVKSSRENLGIVVSGGNGSPRGNLPIFVQDVLPLSVLGKDKRIKRGDLLCEINSIKLTGLSHTQAMNFLRESAQQREVTLVVYELDYDGKAEDEALWDELTSLHQNPSKWAPSWKMWLAATRDFSAIKEIVLRRSSNSNYGFKITGGLSEETGPLPIFITHVSKTSTANKVLKCGDEIVSINKRPVRDLHYMQVLNLMRSVNSITLKVVSWPGSLH